jgi:methionine-rich copper-binding protein CopC
MELKAQKRMTAVLLMLVALTMMPRAAAAHAILLESTPAAKSTVEGPDVSFRLRFNVRIDASRSRLTLVSSKGTARPLVLEKQPSADVLTTKATGLEPGEYHLQWQVLASDGHITRGDIPFRVGKP